MTRTALRAVLVDLDDTIYPQAEFLEGAWAAVADAAADFGLPPDRVRARLHEVASLGSARGRIIDRALESLSTDGPARVPLPPLLEAFRGYRPLALSPYPGALRALGTMAERVPLALISDGEVAGQQAKVDALGLSPYFEVVVLSDRLGRQFRKPHPAPFRQALRALRVDPDAAVMIGDRPDKDIAGAAAAGVRAVRVLTGEYAGRPDHPHAWASVPTLSAAADFLMSHLPRTVVRPATLAESETSEGGPPLKG